MKFLYIDIGYLLQKKVIQYLCPVSDVGGYSGEDNVDYWDKKKWDMELAKYQVSLPTDNIFKLFVSIVRHPFNLQAGAVICNCSRLRNYLRIINTKYL